MRRPKLQRSCARWRQLTDVSRRHDSSSCCENTGEIWREHGVTKREMWRRQTGADGRRRHRQRRRRRRRRPVALLPRAHSSGNCLTAPLSQVVVAAPDQLPRRQQRVRLCTDRSHHHGSLALHDVSHRFHLLAVAAAAVV